MKKIRIRQFLCIFNCNHFNLSIPGFCWKSLDTTPTSVKWRFVVVVISAWFLIELRCLTMSVADSLLTATLTRHFCSLAKNFNVQLYILQSTSRVYNVAVDKMYVRYSLQSLSYRRLMLLLLLLLVGFKQKHTAARTIKKRRMYKKYMRSEFQTSYYIPLIRHYAFRLVFFLPVRKTRRVESCNILFCLFQCQPDVYSLLLTLTYTYTQSVWLADITRKKNTKIFFSLFLSWLLIYYFPSSFTDDDYTSESEGLRRRL